MPRFIVGLSILLVGLLVGCSSLPATETGEFDHRHIEYAQMGHGTPVVVFENGLGVSMGNWSKVFPEIAKETTVFAYNRPGYGRSDPKPTTRDGAHVVDELRALLRNHDLPPPYVLVGHSLGGLYMQQFARQYPDEVVGLVLVDSTHPTQMEGVGRLERQPWWARLLFHLFQTGVLRREYDAAMPTGQEVLHLPTVAGKPVVVLSAIDTSTSDAVKHINKKRADIANLYPGSHQLWVESGHFIQRDRPEVVIDAIRDILR